MKGIAVATKLFGRSSKSYQVIQTMVFADKAVQWLVQSPPNSEDSEPFCVERLYVRPISARVCEGHPLEVSWQL